MGSHLLIQKHAGPADTLLKISNMHQEHCCPQELVLNLTAQGDNKIEVVQDAEVLDLNEANEQNEGMGQTEANDQSEAALQTKNVWSNHVKSAISKWEKNHVKSAISKWEKQLEKMSGTVKPLDTGLLAPHRFAICGRRGFPKRGGSHRFCQ